MSSASKVGEIFCEAGEAFTQLASLTARLHQHQQLQQKSAAADESANYVSGKWSDAELRHLREAVAQFGCDVQKISRVIRSRSVNQIRCALKRRVLDPSRTGLPQSPVKGAGGGRRSSGAGHGGGRMSPTTAAAVATLGHPVDGKENQSLEAGFDMLEVDPLAEENLVDVMIKDE